ncbi:general stress protein [Dictyobacter formicarum]|uniref:General stress protein 17M-like domain-containing protein n=1 Tax=Dictyobacter formicarum TaxID=2778368 RepID=A0ABQ3VR19_9CHLR|nr:general stress protein [Dictyobacter formicarum]GHO88707.1 hypothetical protein KSZ_67130 [Dictyobacter formicarum]
MSVTPSPTVVGVFRDRALVEQAIEALYQAGFSQDQIRYSVPGHSGGFLDDLKSLFTGSNSGSGDLANDLTAMGLSSEQARYYANEYDNGNIVLAVHALDREQEALGIFHQFGAYGIHNTLRGAETANEDAAYAQPPADANRQPVGYAQQSTDYEQQLSGYTQRPSSYAQQPASATWDEDTNRHQPLNEDTDPRYPVNDEQPTASDYTDNNTYNEQSSVVAPVGVADQQNLPDNIEPESVVDHPDLPDSNVAAHEPATSDEYQAVHDHQEQAVQDYEPSATDATTPEEYRAAEHECDVKDETEQQIGDGSHVDPYRMPDHATSTEEQSAHDNTPATHAANNDYPTTVTYDETPQTPTNDNSTSTTSENMAANTLNTTTPDTAAVGQATPMSSVDQSMTAATPASQREEKMRLLQQRLEAAQQRLQDSKAQLQSAKEHESQLQSLKQQLDAIEAELEKNEAELRETHSRIEQYY